MIDDNLSFMESTLSSLEQEDDENHPFYEPDKEIEDVCDRQENYW